MLIGKSVNKRRKGKKKRMDEKVNYIFTSDKQVVIRAAEYLKGFSIEAIVTCILFSFIGYFNGHSQTLFVMMQGIAQSFLVRLPMSYFMSIQPEANLTMIGLAAPTATIFGILINMTFFVVYNKRLRNNQDIKLY